MSWALTQESDLVLPAGAFLDVKGRRQENIPSWIIRRFIHFQKVMGEGKKTGCFFRLSIWSGQLHDLGQSTSHFQTSVPLRSHAALTLYTFNSRGLFMEGRKCRICQVTPPTSLMVLSGKGDRWPCSLALVCLEKEKPWFGEFANFYSVFPTWLSPGYQRFNNWLAKFLKTLQLALMSWYEPLQHTTGARPRGRAASVNSQSGIDTAGLPTHQTWSTYILALVLDEKIFTTSPLWFFSSCYS